MTAICPRRERPRAASLAAVLAAHLIAAAVLAIGAGGCGRDGGAAGERDAGRDDRERVPAARQAPAAGRGQQDVAVVLIDTLRPDHLGFYGYPRETAPFLARLAERAVVFRRAWSTSSWTAPATASLFTSMHPARHGVTMGFFAHQDRVREIERDGASVLPLNRIAGDLATLPERFRAAGYRTFGLASNVNIGPELGFDRGFDRFSRKHGAPAGLLVDQLLSWLEREPDPAPPRLVYLHLNDVHAPYEPLEPWYRRSRDELADTVSRYDSGISYVDAQLERLFARAGWEEQTIVAVVSDHGEELMDHGETGHGHRLYRELLQVLAMIAAPGVPPSQVSENVSLLDVLPTIVELARVESADPTEGRSLVPLMLPGRGAPRPVASRSLVAHRAHPQTSDHDLWSIVRDDWHLIVGRGREQLFDLARDPTEREERSAREPEERARLQQHLDAFRARPAAPPERVEVELDGAALERLKTLGYVAE